MGKAAFCWAVNGTSSWTGEEGNALGAGAGYDGVGSNPEARVTRTLNEAFTVYRLQWGDNSTNDNTGKKLVIKKNGSESGLEATGPDDVEPPNFRSESWTGGPISFTSGDTVALIRVPPDNPSVGSSFRCFAINTVLEAADDNQVALYAHARNTSASIFDTRMSPVGGVTTSYFPVCGGGVLLGGSASANQDVRITTPGTLKDGIVYVVSNPASDDVHIRSYINGAQGNLDIVIPAGQTGEFTDFSNADLLFEGDELQLQATIDNEANVDISYAGFSIESNTNGKSDYFSHSNNVSGHTIDDTVEFRTHPYGQLSLNTSSNWDLMEAAVGFDCTVVGLWIAVEVNSLTPGNSVEFGFTKNGVRQAASLTLTPSSGTGYLVGNTVDLALGENDTFSIWMQSTETGVVDVRATGFAAVDNSFQPGQVIFSDFVESTNFQDWIIDGATGAEFTSYLETFYHMPEDHMLWMQSPYIYTHQRHTDSDTINYGLTLKAKWDWIT